MLQTLIDHIVEDRDMSREKKFQALQALLKQHDFVYVDLDDTLTTNYQFFFLKYFFYRYLKQLSRLTIYKKMVDHFLPNPKFLKLYHRIGEWKKIFIVSRNQYSFVKYFIDQTQELFARHSIVIAWGVGSILEVPRFMIFSKDKSKIFPHNALFISDIFEHQEYQNYKYFYSVDSLFSKKEYFLRNIKKLWHLLWYVIKNLFK